MALHQTYPQLPVYASEVTVQLLPLQWPILLEEIGSFCQGLAIGNRRSLSSMILTVEIFPAGHLPGSRGAIHLQNPQTRL
jgi:Cft2 family RNA processing exonuclease